MTDFEIFQEVYNRTKIYNYANGESAIFVNNEKILIENGNILRIAQELRYDMTTVIFKNGRVSVMMKGKIVELLDEENDVIINTFKKYFDNNINNNEKYNFYYDFCDDLVDVYAVIRKRI